VLAQPEPDLPAPSFASETIAASIELRNIRFRYADGEPWVIDDVSLTVQSFSINELVPVSTILLRKLLWDDKKIRALTLSQYFKPAVNSWFEILGQGQSRAF
jgi:hypothetical protein